MGGWRHLHHTDQKWTLADMWKVWIGLYAEFTVGPIGFMCVERKRAALPRPVWTQRWAMLPLRATKATDQPEPSSMAIVSECCSSDVVVSLNSNDKTRNVEWLVMFTDFQTNSILNTHEDKLFTLYIAHLSITSTGYALNKPDYFCYILHSPHIMWYISISCLVISVIIVIMILTCHPDQPYIHRLYHIHVWFYTVAS